MKKAATRPKQGPAVPLRKKAWVLYVLRCGDGSLYCGITNDLKKRVENHRAGKGARYTRGRGPLRLVRSWVMKSRSLALKMEFAFKRLNRREKNKILKAAGGRLVLPTQRALPVRTAKAKTPIAG